MCVYINTFMHACTCATTSCALDSLLFFPEITMDFPVWRYSPYLSIHLSIHLSIWKDKLNWHCSKQRALNFSLPFSLNVAPRHVLSEQHAAAQGMTYVCLFSPSVSLVQEKLFSLSFLSSLRSTYKVWYFCFLWVFFFLIKMLQFYNRCVIQSLNPSHRSA